MGMVNRFNSIAIVDEVNETNENKKLKKSDTTYDETNERTDGWMDRWMDEWFGWSVGQSTKKYSKNTRVRVERRQHKRIRIRSSFDRRYGN